MTVKYLIVCVWDVSTCVACSVRHPLGTRSVSSLNGRHDTLRTTSSPLSGNASNPPLPLAKLPWVGGRMGVIQMVGEFLGKQIQGAQLLVALMQSYTTSNWSSCGYLPPCAKTEQNRYTAHKHLPPAMRHRRRRFMIAPFVAAQIRLWQPAVTIIISICQYHL